MVDGHARDGPGEARWRAVSRRTFIGTGPGDDDDPGASQAGVTNYIDGKLDQFRAYAEPTYVSAPFAEGYEGDSPPGPDTDTVIYVPEDELYRDGHQIEATPQQLCRDGVVEG
jgi:gluconate 2-dehydrogenase gamma chain